MIHLIGLIASVVLPFWNIPLIVRIQRRQSSQDVSLWWVIGVWVCLALMLPAGLSSTDVVFRVFTAVNFVFFTAVALQVLRFR